MKIKFDNFTPPNRLKEVEREVAIAIARVAFFVSPRVVRRIAQLNQEWKSDFTRDFGHKIQIDHYFYEGSACVLPAVRRHASKQDRTLPRKKFHESAGAIIDANWFPRELWSFVCIGAKYSPRRWQTSGLGQFELAHVLPHKDTEWKLVRDWFAKAPRGSSLHGLFTCAANVILLPQGMSRPTDGTAGIRLAVLKRYFDLYGSTHACGYDDLQLTDKLGWLADLKWNDPVEPPDWEDRIEALDEFRKDKLKKLLI